MSDYSIFIFNISSPETTTGKFNWCITWLLRESHVSHFQQSNIQVQKTALNVKKIVFVAQVYLLVG
jgi:hypothetical protein